MSLLKERAKYWHNCFNVRKGRPYLPDGKYPYLEESIKNLSPMAFCDNFIITNYKRMLLAISMNKNSESLVDTFFVELANWLKEGEQRIVYLTEAMKMNEAKDGMELLKLAQKKHLQEIEQEVLRFLNGDKSSTL